MKALRCASALLLAFAAPAGARSAAWCQVNGSNFQTYLSGIVEIEDGPEAFKALAKGPFAKSFKEYVQASYDPRASKLDCNKQESRFYAEDYIDVLISANPGYKFVKTGWHGIRSTAAAEPTRGKASGGTSTLRCNDRNYLASAVVAGAAALGSARTSCFDITRHLSTE